MPYTEHMAEAMRADLGMQPGLSEKKMFGGFCALTSSVPIDLTLVQGALAFRHQMPAGFRVQCGVVAQKCALAPPFDHGQHHTKNQQSAKDEIQNFHLLNMELGPMRRQGREQNTLH